MLLVTVVFWWLSSNRPYSKSVAFLEVNFHMFSIMAMTLLILYVCACSPVIETHWYTPMMNLASTSNNKILLVFWLLPKRLFPYKNMHQHLQGNWFLWIISMLPACPFWILEISSIKCPLRIWNEFPSASFNYQILQIFCLFCFDDFDSILFYVQIYCLYFAMYLDFVGCFWGGCANFLVPHFFSFQIFFSRNWCFVVDNLTDLTRILF